MAEALDLTMPKRFTRFAVGDPAGLRSSEWLVIWNTNTSDIYIMSRVMGDVFKASIHQSGRCHVRAPDATKWRGEGPPPTFLDTWRIDPSVALVYPFGIIVPTSELRAAAWPLPHKRTVWLPPASTATEIGLFLAQFAPEDERLGASGWHTTIARDSLPDGRQLAVVVGNPELPSAKRDELLALKKRLAHLVLPSLDNPRLVIIAGEGTGTRHFVEAAMREV